MTSSIAFERMNIWDSRRRETGARAACSLHAEAQNRGRIDIECIAVHHDASIQCFEFLAYAMH